MRESDPDGPGSGAWTRRAIPAEFLPFTQVKPGMQVLDVSAGAGYTSQLLGARRGATGTVWAQANSRAQRLRSDSPIIAGQSRARDTSVRGPGARSGAEARPHHPHPQLPRHHLLPVDRTKMNQRLFAALKPGGHFIVIDSFSQAGADIAVGKPCIRIDEAIVLAEVRKAGFVLEAESNFLRDPPHARGVFRRREDSYRQVRRFGSSSRSDKRRSRLRMHAAPWRSVRFAPPRG